MRLKELFQKFKGSRAGDFLLNFAVVLFFTLSLSWLLDYDPYSLIEGSGDFNSGDYYDRIYHENTTLPVDRDIIIVATDRIPNDKLPEVLRRVSGYGARAIGLDLVFRNESSISDELIDVIDSLPQIVMPVELEYDSESGSFARGEPSLLNEYVDGKPEATVTFPPRPIVSFQRENFLRVHLADNDSIESFALVLARMKKPDLEISPGAETEAINFNISEFEVISYDELYDPDLQSSIAALIDGRIVLLGDVENKYDLHPTAVDDNMAGVKVQGAAIATLLSERPIRPLSRLWNILFMIVCVAVVTIMDSYFSDKDDFRKGLTFLVVKGFFLFLMLFGGYALYIHLGIRSDFTYSLTLFMFSMVIADLWFGLRNYLTELKARKLEKQNNNQ